jgi:hypothetical protein
MAEERKARLDIIDDQLGFDENVQIDVLALLLDPGRGLKKREAEGHLVLTDRRLIFGTARHGILVDVTRKEIGAPASIIHKWMMARLEIETDTGARHTFVVNKTAARDLAFAVNNAAQA